MNIQLRNPAITKNLSITRITNSPAYSKQRLVLLQENGGFFLQLKAKYASI